MIAHYKDIEGEKTNSHEAQSPLASDSEGEEMFERASEEGNTPNESNINLNSYFAAGMVAALRSCAGTCDEARSIFASWRTGPQGPP
jgi:hypothetical protein